MIKDSLNLGIVGATGLVGRAFLKVLEEKSLPIEEIELFATKKSAGTILTYKNIQLEVQDIEKADFDKYDVLLFSAGKEASLKYVPIAVKSGCLVIDNGSFWRMHPEVPLIVPEVNFQDSLNHKGIIANPNCSTIQLVVALKPIYEKFGLRKVEVSTYQAISGAGQKGIDKLFQEIETGRTIETLSKHPIAFNINFHKISGKYNYSEEEIKIINETKKILHNTDLKVSATCVRIPVVFGHCESVSLITEKPFELDEIENVLISAPGITLYDDPEIENYPTPKIVEGHDNVFVGRLRKSLTDENGLLMWVVADNIRKGAASNAIQILAKLWYQAREHIFNFKKLFE